MISLICVHNDTEKLTNILKASLDKQEGVDYELIAVDSKKHQFESAAEALNFGGKQAKGSYLFFVHQDVNFQDSHELANLVDYCEKTKFGLAGVAGVKASNDGLTVVANIFHGEPRKPAGSQRVAEPIPVEAVDECLLIVPQEVFQQYQFTNIGPTWHLYGTDYALQMKTHQLPVVVFPSDLWHVSDGKSLNLNYFDAIQWLSRKYEKDFSEINTIFGSWPTARVKLKLKCWYRKLRFRFKGV